MAFTLWPLLGTITTRFSARHPALDIAAPEGSVIRAPAAGRVVSVGCDALVPVPVTARNRGCFMVVDHPDGWQSRYFHLAPHSQRVQAGEPVQCGQVLGLAGETGSTTGPHLHFELLNRSRRCPEGVSVANFVACDPLLLLPAPPPGGCPPLPPPPPPPPINFHLEARTCDQWALWAYLQQLIAQGLATLSNLRTLSRDGDVDTFIQRAFGRNGFATVHSQGLRDACAGGTPPPPQREPPLPPPPTADGGALAPIALLVAGGITIAIAVGRRPVL